MPRFVRRFASLLLILAAATAQQQPDPPPAAQELPFLKDAARELNVYATLAFKNGFPKRAHDLWIEVVAEYDRDDAVAREQLGYTAVGSAWQPKPGFEFPDRDEPDAKNAKMLEGRWKATARRLADGHQKLAQQLQTAGNDERARYHFQRALRFAPDDSKAQQALGAETVEGITGTALDLELLRRSRLLERLVTQLTDTEYPVEQVELTDPRLEKAKASYSAVKSEHFTFFGDWDPEILKEAAQWSERSLQFCIAAYDGYDAWKAPPLLTPRYAFFSTRAAWAEVVRANAAAIPEVDFVLANTSACTVGGTGTTGLHLAGQTGIETVFDFSARKVAQEYSHLDRDAMTEGIGHAIVGLFFGRNLITLVAQQKKEGTAVGRDYARFQLPDIETWKDLARELAFEKSTAPAAHLPLITAAFFTFEERIKSWSFCDYLLRRDPMLLQALNRSSAKARNDFDVMAAFQEETRLALRGVEDDWRTFYTGDSAALQAIRDKVTPMQAVSKDAPAWLEEFNRMRRLHDHGAVGWSADFSVLCKDHVEYLKQNKGARGVPDEFTQASQSKGYSSIGRLFAQNALVSTDQKDARKALESWMYLPGFRDAILDTTLKTVGIYADGPLLAMDVQRGRELKGFTKSSWFPYPNQKDKQHYNGAVPSSLDVDQVGPELRALLEKHGRGKQKTIGFPLTAHYFGGDPGDLQCTVTVGGTPVAGVLERSGGGTRRVAAPGMWVFWPFDPLPKGVEITVIWAGKGEPTTVIFQTS